MFVCFSHSGDTLLAQSTDITFEQLFLQHGLSQSIVKSIVQDRKGFMYFGTEDGLNRYDGYKFSVIRHKPEDTNSLSYNDISALCVDRKGNIWIGTFNAGLNLYDPAAEKYIKFQNTPNDANSLSHNNIHSIIEDLSGNIWVGSERGLNKLTFSAAHEGTYRIVRFLHDPHDANSLSHDTVYALCQDKTGDIWIGTAGGLSKLPHGKGGETEVKFMRFRHDDKDPYSLSDDTVWAILQDRRSILWIGTNRGLNRLSNKNETPAFIRYQHDPRDSHSISHDQIYALAEDKAGTLWIGTNGGGINLLDREKDTFTRYTHDPLNPRSISYDEIRSIYRDRQGIMWIGTYGAGIDKVSRGAKQFIHFNHIPNDPNSLSHAIVWTIYEDKNETLWIGTHGGGLDRLDRKNNQFKHYRFDPNDPDSLSSNIVRMVRGTGDGSLWIGTHGGGICKFDPRTEKFKVFRNDPHDPSSLGHDEVRDIYRDRSGTIWIGTYGHGLDKLDGQTGKFTHFRNDPNNPRSLSNNFVRTIHEDGAGNFWIGTEGGGLNKFDRSGGTFSAFRANGKVAESISNDYIFAIHQDKNNILWLGTWGGGLNKFDPRTETCKSFTTRNGLPSDAIYGIMEDEKGNLWISTNNGLAKFDPAKETFKNFGSNDGLQGREFNGGSYFKSGSGEMFFGGINGFNAFFPSRIEPNTYIPPVVIESFQKFNKDFAFKRPIHEMAEIELSYEDYVFSFEFAALDFTSPGKNMYAYKMEGLGEDWITTDSEKRFAHFTTISPGRYVFRVIGSNSDGVWNETGASLQIIIIPPYWQTWWFMVLIALALFALASVLYRRRLRIIGMKAELKTAHDAQMSIMPGADPQIPGLDISGTCIPANEVGGDFFDFFWIDRENSKYGILIGDVSGKAMKAAMTAVMASGMILSEAHKATAARTILSHVNTPLFNKTNSQMFVSACLVLIDMQTKEFFITNAGQTSPLLKSGDSIETVDLPGPKFPLGMIAKVDYEEKKLQLQSGDLLIFSTDGVTDTHNRYKEFYGEQKLKDLLLGLDTIRMTSSQIKDAIVADVKKFSGKQQQFDDMTVVTVKML